MDSSFAIFVITGNVYLVHSRQQSLWMANPRPCDGALAGAPMSVFSLPKTVASAEFPERCGLASRSGSVVRDFGGTSYEVSRVRSSLVVSKWLDTTSIGFLPKHSMHKRVSHGKD